MIITDEIYNGRVSKYGDIKVFVKKPVHGHTSIQRFKNRTQVCQPQSLHLTE